MSHTSTLARAASTTPARCYRAKYTTPRVSKPPHRRAIRTVSISDRTRSCWTLDRRGRAAFSGRKRSVCARFMRDAMCGSRRLCTAVAHDTPSTPFVRVTDRVASRARPWASEVALSIAGKRKDVKRTWKRASPWTRRPCEPRGGRSRRRTWSSWWPSSIESCVCRTGTGRRDKECDAGKADRR